MPVLVHLSDLHFGPALVNQLAELVLRELEAIHPDLVVVSGDWTMRGRVAEYERARDYLRRLPPPVLTIPGNHDQPLHLNAIAERLFHPWSRYERFIHEARDSVFRGSGLFVVGLNDNHPILPGGIWTVQQRRWMEEQFLSAPPADCKVLVMHHHLLWEGKLRPAGQWFPSRTLRRLGRLGVELVLNGHTHIPITRQVPEGPIIAQAGTAMSSRTRHGNGNTFNVIVIEPATIRITVRRFDSQRDLFQDFAHYDFARRTVAPRATAS